MNKPMLLAAAVLVGVIVLPKMVKKYQKWSTHEDLQHIVANTRLPHQLGAGETETRAELGDQVLRTWYVFDATIEDDDATRDQFKAIVQKTACKDPAPLQFLSRGYALDRTYEFPTPRGRGQFHFLITPADCGVAP